jgi:indolepyruvate ferredoxin oxidoreductase
MSYEILNGNELIIQGGLEAGFSLYTGYPGSPLAEFFNILYARKNELSQEGIRVVIANSEANAAAMASGAKQAGRDCLVAMKSMGLHVASDALSVGNFANPAKPYKDEKTGETLYPGTVVIVGDDPWSMSTSTAADSRYLYKHLHMSFLEPSTPQELKDWIKHALKISKKTSLYQGLLLTTAMAEGGGRVETYDRADVPKEKSNLDPAEFDLSKNVMVPPNSLLADVSMVKERFPRVKEVLAELDLDQIFGYQDSKVGFITSGVVFETVKQIFQEGNYLETFSLYKLACSFPLVENKLLPYLKNLKKLVVIEEKRGFLETELREFCQKHGLEIEILGKNFGDTEGFPAYGGLNFEIINQKLGELLRKWDYFPCETHNYQSSAANIDLPRRLPTFCPGCPHRETLSLLKDLRAYLDKQGIKLISHGDVGCYSLSFLPPFKEMHNLSAMGQGGALGAGVDMFTDNPSVVLMGDSTFFHSGVTDISNSVQMDHNITYIILNNDNTAMTGHQMTPASGLSVEGKQRPRQDIKQIVKGIGVSEVLEVNPSDRYFYQNLMRDFVSKSGTKVIVSNKECALTYQARVRSKERKDIESRGEVKKKTFYQINTDACVDCRECVDNTGCPGLTQTHDAYGAKVAIDPQICVGDSYCTKLKVCPSFEMVEVVGYHPTKYKDTKEQKFDFNYIPMPSPLKTLDQIAQGQTWSLVVTGVGGSGITTISKIISKAALDMEGRNDLDFKFFDQKGLAQRNGNVTSHMALCPKDYSMGAVTPQGRADVLVSPDLLDGIGKLDFLSAEGHALFDEDYQIPLSILLDKEVERPAVNKKSLLRSLEGRDGVETLPLKKWANNLLGKPVYSTSMILGAAYQSGLIPFQLEHILNAIKKAIKGPEVENNIIAFNLGRELVHLGKSDFEYKYKSDIFGDNQLDLYRLSIKESMLPWQNKKYFIEKFNNAFNKAANNYAWIKKSHLAQMIHDQIIFNRGSELDQFVAGIDVINKQYSEEDRFIALHAFAKSFFVKDEVMVAHLMLSPLLRKRDQKMYGAIGRKFKKQRINRPSFDVMGKKIEFDISPSDWMLNLMRHGRFLRVLLPMWHRKERLINKTIREHVLHKACKSDTPRVYLKTLENIKGYRDVLYKNADKAFESLGV